MASAPKSEPQLEPQIQAEPQPHSDQQRMPSQRRGHELEKFKRRMIRAVARRLREKKKEDEVWEDMKKEIGSNCKKLWERMRMLTLKKLKRLLEADDRVCNIGQVARMTLTDWLLFDLVIVHEKIDVIDRDRLTQNYNSKVLWNLFSLVQRFEIEGRVGENLAEAWTAATVYYNSKGHQCSPMMLQRRWYQVTELTRHKFYKFWYKYRGNMRQLEQAKLDSPDDLQKAIALKYPKVITQPFPSWEERIQNRLVILPEELGVKMRQTKLMKPSDVNAPDVVLIEPQIEVIDLGDDSEFDDNDADTIEVTKGPTARVKSEPVDVDEHFEIEEAVFTPQEKGSEFEAEIERLQMVEEKISDADDEPHVDDPTDIGVNDETIPSTQLAEPINDPCNDNIPVNENVTETVTVAPISTVERDDTCENAIDEDAIIIEDDEELGRTHSTVSGIIDVMAERESDADGTVDRSVEIIEANSSILTTEIDNLNHSLQSQEMEIVMPEEHLPVISIVSSAGVEVENNIDNEVLISSDRAMMTNICRDPSHTEVTEILPVISTVSSAGIKVEMETSSIEFELDLERADENQHEKETEQEPVVDNAIPIEDDIINLDIPQSKDVVKDKASTNVNDLVEFGDIPQDLTFVEEGIEFADDGIEYVEDEDDIIIMTDPPIKAVKKDNGDHSQGEAVNEEEDGEDLIISDEETTKKTESKKFDLKLLMYPVVYTTKLETMLLFDDETRYEHVCDKESIEKILTLSKPVSRQAINNVDKPEHNIHNLNSSEPNVVENNANNNGDDDDPFQNESDSETEIIDDSKRVKLSSYLLQKPRNRSYNPILLCKNPDFNTRLKRLTVGFFMSARNRMLLQSCKPMTVDMSKAFESKLISGTIYLKPTPSDAVVNIPDDTQITSADLIKPSAVQQSLMNIDDTLENGLKKRIAERNRAINLPDISEVRRLNQHLKTAEVIPLRLNEISPPDVTKHSSMPIQNATTPINYVENIKNDIEKLLSQQKTNAEKTEIIVDPIILMQPQQVQPTLIAPSEVPHAPMVVSNNVIPSIQNKTKQVLVNNTSSQSLTSQLLNNTYLKSTDKNKTEKIRKFSRKTYYPRLPWDKFDVTPSNDDSLLTLDTLYKMLSALDPYATTGEMITKNKKKNRMNVSNTDNTKTSETDENKTDSYEVNDIGGPVIDKTDDSVKTAVQTNTKPKVFIHRNLTPDYCCWCRYKIDNLYGRVLAKRKHKCPPSACKCCCILLFMQDIQCKNSKESAVRKLIKQLENKRVSQSIENVVNETNHAVTSIQAFNSNNDAPVPMNQQTDNLMPSVQITIEPSSNTTNDSEDWRVRLSPTRSQPMPSFVTRIPRTSLGNRNTSEIYKAKRGRPKKLYYPCTCGPSITQVNQTKIIEINGGGYCIQHKKQLKESKIYLSKKHVTMENQPFFVGKGKILLTNLKIPKSNAEVKTPLPVQTGPSISPVPPLVPSEGTASLNSYPQNFGNLPSTLPAGVQIIMLPDQTISYLVQPELTLASEEHTKLANFLFGIQHQVNAVGVTLPASHSAAKTSEVIDLDNDESPEANNLRSVSSSQASDRNNTNSTVANDSDQFAPASKKDIQIDAENNTLMTSEVIDLDSDESSEANIPQTVSHSISSTSAGSVNSTVAKDDASEQFAPASKESIRTDVENNTLKSKPAIENEGAATSEASEHQCIDNTDPKHIGAIANPLTNCEGPLPDNEKMKMSETSKNTEENIIVVPETDTTLDNNQQQLKETESSKAGETTNKKNLLSDLMEMSGIFEDDTVPPAQEMVQEPVAASIAFHDMTSQPAVSDASLQIDLPVPSLSPLIQKQNEFELNAVTSFAELKYACDNNGLFFKLDLDTGEMTSINVCIQKFSSGRLQTKVGLDKSVIDLTDEPDICITGSTGNETSTSAKRLPSKAEISSILMKKRRLMERLSNNLKPVNILQSKQHISRILKRNRSLIRDPSFMFYSKRNLDKIEAQIGTIDSDAEVVLDDDSGSDSDDEPLIKKAKRMRDAEAAARAAQPEDNNQVPNTQSNESLEQDNVQDITEQESNGNNLDDNVESQDGEQDCMVDVEYLEDIDDMDDMIPTDIIQPEVMPVPTNLVLSGNALNAHNIPLEAINGNVDADNSQDDCILGV